MSRRGSGHAPDTQRRPSNQRPPPQAYHEDSYQRSSSHELSDDEISYMPANRHVRIPGLTPHHDPYRYVPSSSSQYPMTFTVLGNAGSDVGREPHDELLSRRRIHEARARPNTEGRNPSWPFREPAEPAMFTPASARVCTYPMDIEIAPGPPAHIHDQRERDAHPGANEPEAVPSDSPLGSPPRISRLLHDHHPTQGNSVHTDPQRQQPRRRLPAHSGPSTINHNRSKHPQYDD